MYGLRAAMAFDGDITDKVAMKRHLRDLTFLMGMLHLIFSFMAVINRLDTLSYSYLIFINKLLISPFWAGTFLIVGIWLLLSLRTPSLSISATGMSAGTLLVWGTLCFLKALTSITPVELSAGIGGIALGFVSLKLCTFWAITEVQVDKVEV